MGSSREPEIKRTLHIFTSLTQRSKGRTAGTIYLRPSLKRNFFLSTRSFSQHGRHRLLYSAIDPLYSRRVYHCLVHMPERDFHGSLGLTISARNRFRYHAAATQPPSSIARRRAVFRGKRRFRHYGEPIRRATVATYRLSVFILSCP